jgi:hypothetical protein|tara:strand:- start:203 stop:529 length:327 start_codon:yes stop_codon:yes gene_type:complete
MAFTAFHNINSATDGQEVELIAAGDNAGNVKSILLTNVDSAAITVDLFLQEVTSSTRYHLLFNVSLPVGASLLLDNSDMLAFNNGSDGFSLNLNLGTTSDLINVLIKI